jgi:hypothetical protein
VRRCTSLARIAAGCNRRPTSKLSRHSFPALKIWDDRIIFDPVIRIVRVIFMRYSLIERFLGLSLSLLIIFGTHGVAKPLISQSECSCCKNNAAKPDCCCKKGPTDHHKMKKDDPCGCAWKPAESAPAEPSISSTAPFSLLSQSTPEIFSMLHRASIEAVHFSRASPPARFPRVTLPLLI